MANIPAKIIERKLKKEGVNVEGYSIIEGIEFDYIEEAKTLGMDDGITEEYDFLSEFSINDQILTFYGSVVEEYLQISPNQEVPYYYPYLDYCKITGDGKEEIIVELDVYWKKC
ncbi:hypothetical protein [Lysinibacillus varians]|uniref:Uncharacterized protein n=1 Tax=Lysinibacillus varians TaxID=1145276 RepID=A0ABY2TI62_9BACI|nr:hypothetical protein [Lysinibacillus varians]AHN24501.1 hypothetical protein T479_20780 [Lysinibacillus varians]TKI67042.1 hypothetical protein FC752_03140 [Lysinibacillus varians]